MIVPLPNWPELFAPQHLTVPPADNAHECEPPAAIATTPDKPLTLTAVDAFVIVPLPNWPERLPPQHFTVPPADNAHECEPPATIAIGPTPKLKPTTAPGVDELVVVPLPNWP